MARKNSLGCGTAIIGLIALAMTAKYWYVLVVIGFVALTIWGVIKVLKSWSIETGNAATTPIERDFDNGNIMVTDSFSGLSRSIETGNTDTLIAKHFVDNGDGTVTDSHTGLSWMRCAMGQTWDGIACNGGATLCTWKQAKALSLPYSFAGRNDWRLPTCDELKSIVEPHQKEPAINTDIFSQTACLDFWSSSPYDKDSIHAWIVDFSVGVAYLSNRIIGRSVRLVRGGQDIEKAAASEVGTAKKAADAEVAANSITDTPAPIVISATEANTLINHCTPQNNPDLLVKILDRNNTNMKVDHVNAVIGKDPASEKAAAEVAMKIINRLGAALVDTEIQRTLDAKKAALLERVAQVDAEIEKVLAAEKKVQIIKRLLAVLECIRTQRILDAEKVAMRERVAQVNAEIEQILATEKAAASAVITVEKAAAAEVTVKESASEEEITNRLGSALVDAEIERILVAEKAASQERVVLVDSEIGRDLSTENAIDIPAEIDKTEKQIEKRIGHFIDNGNGTVTDTRTELTWMRYAMGQAKDGIAKNTYTWEKVMAFRYSFAGHDDWRLPTRDELKSIVDPSRENPAINTEAFPQTVNSWFWSSTPFVGRSGYAWVISFHNGRNNYLKRNTDNFVRLVRGGQNVSLLDQKSTEHLVTLAAPAAVSCEKPKTPSETKAATDLDEINEKAALQERISARQILDVGKAVLQEGTAQINSEIGSSPITENTTTTPVDNDKTDNSVKKRIGHFIDNGDGTATDPITKLTWMRCAAGQTWDGTSCQGKANTYSLNQAMALRHTFAGYDDWRLPTRDELESIVDLNRTNPAINIDALPQIAGSWFWSSSLNSNHTHSAWSTNFESGHVISLCSGYIRGDDNLFVRLVRGGQCVNALNTEAILPAGGTLILPDKNTSVVQERAHQSGNTNARINVSDILTNLFMAKYTIFSSMDEIDTAWGFNPLDQDKFFSIQDKEWNDFIRLSTSFDSWETMLSVASKEWASRNNFPLDHDSTVNKTQKKTHKPSEKYSFDELVVKEKIVRKISTEAMFEPKIVASIKHYDLVFTKNIVLKTSDQWFEETVQWRRLTEGSLKVYAWLLPFLPLEVAKLSDIRHILDRGPKSASVITKHLRGVIRKLKKDLQPHEDLLRALYASCVLMDFAKSLSSEGVSIKIMARYVDIRELRNIRIDYLTMGYHYIESLTKNDIKWLIEMFGEPAEHQSFDDLWPNIRRNALSRLCWEQLQKDHKTSSSSGFAQVSIVEWLQKLVNLNLIIHKEWLERQAAHDAQLAAKPVTVKTADFVKQRGYAVPAPPKPSHSFSLDMSSIEAKLVETVAVSAILKDIFSEDAPVPPQTTVPDSTTTEASIAGLDAKSFSFMQALASKHIWARDELEKLANHHSLLLDGTLDSINDASYDHFGGPFFEGDDPIEINTEFAKEIAA